MAYIAMAYIVMAYIVRAYKKETLSSGRSTIGRFSFFFLVEPPSNPVQELVVAFGVDPPELEYAACVRGPRVALRCGGRCVEAPV